MTDTLDQDSNISTVLTVFVKACKECLNRKMYSTIQTDISIIASHDNVIDT